MTPSGTARGRPTPAMTRRTTPAPSGRVPLQINPDEGVAGKQQRPSAHLAAVAIGGSKSGA